MFATMLDHKTNLRKTVYGNQNKAYDKCMVHLLIIKLLLLLDLNLKTGLWVFLIGFFMNNLKNELLPDALESPPRIPWNCLRG
jgi:hypothetical protein